MAIYYAGKTATNASGTGTSYNPALPSGVADGDALVAVVFERGGSAHSCSTSGWSRYGSGDFVLGSYLRLSIWYARYKASSPNAGNGETNTAPTITKGTDEGVGYVTAWRGVTQSGSSASIWDSGSATSLTDDTTTTALATAEITTTSDRAMLLNVIGHGHDTAASETFTVTAPASICKTNLSNTTAGQNSGTGSVRMASTVSYGCKVAAGATGTQACTLGITPTSTYHAGSLLLGLVPAAVSGTLFGDIGCYGMTPRQLEAYSPPDAYTPGQNWTSGAHGWTAPSRVAIGRRQMPVGGSITAFRTHIGTSDQPSIAKSERAVIYADNSGVPGALLAVAAVHTTPATAGWLRQVFSSPVSRSAGQYFWIGTWGGTEGTNIGENVDSTPNTDWAYTVYTFSPTTDPVNPFPGMGGDGQWSVARKISVVEYETASEDRSGTASVLSGTGALSTAAGAKAVSGTTATLSGTSDLGTALGAKAVSGTVADLSGTSTLGTAAGAKAVSGTATSLTGSAILDSPTSSRAVSGTVEALAGAGTLGTATGSPGTQSESRSGTAQDFTGASALSSLQGYSAREGVAALLSALASFASASGTADRGGAASAFAGSATLGVLYGLGPNTRNVYSARLSPVTLTITLE